MLKYALALCALLPLSVSFADDQETQPLHGNVYQQFASSACGNSPYDCSIVFPATTHSATVITSVSCVYSLQPGGSIIFASLGSQNAEPRFYIQPFFASLTYGNFYYGINAQVNLFIIKGDSPVVNLKVFASGPDNLGCTLSGYHS